MMSACSNCLGQTLPYNERFQMISYEKSLSHVTTRDLQKARRSAARSIKNKTKEVDPCRSLKRPKCDLPINENASIGVNNKV